MGHLLLFRRFKYSIWGGGEEKDPIQTDVRELSECIATAITFATIQSRRNSKIHGSPTIRIDPAGFDIVVYNPEFDVLLMSHLGWTRKAL